MQIVPQIFSQLQKGAFLAFKIRQNPFPAEGLSRTPLHGPSSRPWRGRHSPYPTPIGTDPPSALAMRPQNSSQIYAYVWD